MCSRDIPFFGKTFKNIHLNSNVFGDFSTLLYDKRSTMFEYLFRIFIRTFITKIDHPEPLEEWNSNLDEVAYKMFWKMVLGNHNLRKKPIVITV